MRPKNFSIKRSLPLIKSVKVGFNEAFYGVITNQGEFLEAEMRLAALRSNSYHHDPLGKYVGRRLPTSNAVWSDP